MFKKNLICILYDFYDRVSLLKKESILKSLNIHIFKQRESIQSMDLMLNQMVRSILAFNWIQLNSYEFK